MSNTPQALVETTNLRAGARPAADFRLPHTEAKTPHDLLSPEAVRFLADLHRAFRNKHVSLLNSRLETTAWLRSGGRPSFPEETRQLREENWSISQAPHDLRCRHVEITGPAEAKMMINALNSGANVFMADLEDALSPTWSNVLQGQRCLREAVRGTLSHQGANGKEYRLGARNATLMVRPRGWHLFERNFLVDAQPISASLFDFGLYFFHNAHTLQQKGSGPYFYLTKLEHAAEARLWNDVFIYAQKALGLPKGTIRATVLIETILAAFEMDEILYELREHSAGLNAGRWDYLFSLIKKLPLATVGFPDRAALTMDLPFLKAYCELLVQTCHRRGAHAIGCMAAFIPSRTDAATNERALAKVRADKEREISQGFDGSWVAHPDLVAPVAALFAERLGGAPDQRETIPAERIFSRNLIPGAVPGRVTDQGIRTNVAVVLKYLKHWLDGQGAVAINNLMEDAATAEISRAQLWQWLKIGVTVQEGYQFVSVVFREILADELAKLQAAEPIAPLRALQIQRLTEHLVQHHDFPEFLTKSAYEILLKETENPIH